MAAKLFVGGLAWATKDDSLKTFFSQVGTVVSALLVAIGLNIGIQNVAKLDRPVNIHITETYSSIELCSKIVTRWKIEPELAHKVIDSARVNRVSPLLIASIIGIESSFNPSIISNTGDFGLMQVNHFFWGKQTKLTKEDLLDVTNNINAGAYILKSIGISRYHSGDPDRSKGYLAKVALEAFRLDSTEPTGRATRLCKTPSK